MNRLSSKQGSFTLILSRRITRLWLFCLMLEVDSFSELVNNHMLYYKLSYGSLFEVVDASICALLAQLVS